MQDTSNYDPANVVGRLKQIVSVQLDIPLDKIDGNAKFHATLGLDSLDVANLINAINIEFNINLTEKDVLAVETFNQMVECIQSRLV